MYEVELKFRVADPVVVERRLAGLGARWAEPIEQIDRYFAHPARDFARTDEALRLRRVGEKVVITWKGPRLSGPTKTRREIELPLATPATAPTPDPTGGSPPTLDSWTELLEALGFQRVLEVAKRRRPARVLWHGVEVEVALDTVVGLGDYLELELVATLERVSECQACIEALAGELGCGRPEPRSYLEMLLEAPDGGPASPRA